MVDLKNIESPGHNMLEDPSCSEIQTKSQVRKCYKIHLSHKMVGESY